MKNRVKIFRAALTPVPKQTGQQMPIEANSVVRSNCKSKASAGAAVNFHQQPKTRDK